MSVYHDAATFSSCNTVSGPFPEFPVPLEGDDISALIEEHRDELPFSDQLPSFDPPKHTEHRGLLMRLITPKRLKENEEFMWRLADRQIDEFLARGECEFIHDYANPFTLLVIADLLGVPEADHASFREELQGTKRASDPHAGQGRRGDGAQAAGVPLRAVHRLHRGVPPRTARRRDDRARDRDVPRRLAARGPRRGADRGQPVRGRPGDDGAPARLRCSSSIAERPELPGAAAGRPRAASRASSRRRCGSRARSRASSGCRGCPRPSAASTCPRAPR